ncbi:MAG: hypothetical protein JWO67_3168 [Streptosporangiaceae bacterium]|nr:hypothetical protein [Streptosporangiaceae bacterium]
MNARRRRRRASWGFRERFYVLPPFIWANLSRSGVSWSFHLGIATWNTRRGWYFRGPLGFYMRFARGWDPGYSHRSHR